MLPLLRRLELIVREKLPGKKIFLIYTHKNGHKRFRNGLKANTEISFWSFNALRNAFPRIVFLKLSHEKPSRIRAVSQQDVVIGHIGETFMKASERTKRLITFGPWVGHEDRSQNKFNCIPKEIEQNYYGKAASVILLTSEFNKKKYLENAANDWHSYFKKLSRTKRVRVVHQPVDLETFNRNKWDYCTSNFFYIGNNAHMKGVDEAKRLVQETGRQFFIYGIDGNFFSHLDSKQVALLPKQADFFIQPGMWEAQCVSILEQAARGFIPIVTPETGYPYDHPFLLKFNDRTYNQKILKEILNTSFQERKSLADQLYQRLVQDENHNNWKKLTDVLVEEVKYLI